jgi:predicted lipid-binding transport protein (Tim44 family)
MAFRHKFLMLTLAGLFALGLAGEACARPGSGSSFGSRGARTFSMPNATPLAPRGAAPMERSYTSPNEGIFRRPAAPYSPGGLFSGSFGRGLLGGFLGAGLFGLLFGQGLFGGLGGGLSILGLILQIGLLYLLFKLVMGFIRGSGFSFQGAGFGARTGTGRGPIGGAAGGAFGTYGGGRQGQWQDTKLEPSPADFAKFEQRLAEVQSAFGTEDLSRLRSLTTPEMASYFAEELAANSGKGLVNKITDVKFVQGDLSEAWREPNAEYATVVMRFSLIGIMAERISGRIVSGDPQSPQLVTEVWTFRRPPGGAPDDWKLSALQQAQ